MEHLDFTNIEFKMVNVKLLKLNLLMKLYRKTKYSKALSYISQGIVKLAKL